MFMAPAPPAAVTPARATAAPAGEPAPRWIAYRVVASVSWARGETISAETVRLGKSTE
jgi:hypothetical protein